MYAIFKFLGFDLNLKNIVNTEVINSKKKYFVKANSIKKDVPNFLVDQKTENIDLSTLLSGLNLVTDYLDKSLKP